MVLREVIQKSLEELKEIAKIEAALFFPDGNYYAGVMKIEKNFLAVFEVFAASGAIFQELAGYYFYQLEEESYILAVRGNKADTAIMGKLVLSQIKNLILVNQEKNSMDTFFKEMLEGKLSEDMIFAKAQKFYLKPELRRAVFLIEFTEGKEEGIFEIIRNIEEKPEEDFIFKIEENMIAFIKKMEKDEGEEEQNQIANTLVDMINVEVMETVRVSFGTPVNHMIELSNSYKEAWTALEVGKIFYAEKKTISFRKLGIGRLLYQLPQDLCENFIAEVVGVPLEKVMDQETLATIQRFFESGLNISETARQLYVHRNTLVYRLEKIQKQLGLDIRQFDDAVTFKIALMVSSYLEWKKR